MAIRSRDEQPPNRVIRQIDQESVKFIAAGEKIGDIEAAIRELVENSIDAEAKNIEVRLSRFGVESLEVHDDGTGILEENFNTLGVRYHTSKINDYSKLQESLETYGFRGEALSCLCSIANVTITTKTKSSPTGTRLIFKKDGTLMKTEPVARTNGTSVIVKNLFHSMPVRRRELETTAKRQYDKVVKLIYEHTLARPHIKMTLCKKREAKKEKDFSHGGTNLEGCIITIYGVKVLETLMPIKQAGLQTQELESCTKKGGKNSDETSANGRKREACDEPVDVLELKTVSIVKNFETTVEPCPEDFFKRPRRSKFARDRPQYFIHGYISRLGQGRNSTDCQYIFVNQKPCDIPKVSRLINETYRNYSSNSQYPFYCLYIKVQPWVADFNVPRKRAVILLEDNKLCDIIRESLEDMFSPSAPGMQNSCSIAHIPVVTPKLNGEVKSPIQGVKRELEPGSGDENDDEVQFVCKKQAIEGESQNIDSCPMNSSREEYREAPEEAPKEATTETTQVTTQEIFQDALCKVSQETNQAATQETTPGETQETNREATQETDQEATQETNQKVFHDIPQDEGSVYFELANDSDRLPVPMDAPMDAPTNVPLVVRDNSKGPSSVREAGGFITALECVNMMAVNEVSDSAAKSVKQFDVDNCQYEQVPMTSESGHLQVHIDHPEDLGAALERERAQRRPIADSKEFSFAIHPNFNTVAEQELKFNLNKSSFEEMQVLGQFNRGFIIARLNKHVFIIDQHATDERANYEDQLHKSPLVKQPMVYPKPLYLNSIQENAVINNLEAFKERGFEFLIDQSKPAGFRVLLTSTSVCKGQGLDEFLTKEDVEELIDVIIESPNSLASYTLKKVKNVAATRACRKSVMIGDKLTWPQMTGIVSKMSTLKNPWVCAHNRPTIRHLMDIDWMEK